MLDNLTEQVVIKPGEKVQIVYFSGTGGTSRAAFSFAKCLEQKGIVVVKVPLDRQEADFRSEPTIEATVGLLLILYPVYAFDAPIPVYEWIEKLDQGKGLSCAVISVSGGGEIWPNTFSRLGSIKALESRGYNVFYERMLVMPANVFSKTDDICSMQILKVLPLKTEHCVNEILAGQKRRTKKPFGAGIIAFLAKMEKSKSISFGQALRINGKCTGCVWCAENCPRKNIYIEDGRPVFGKECIICLRCLYGCPQKAIYNPHYSFLLLKEGYSLDELEESMKEQEALPEIKIKSGYLYWGVKKYLENIDF